MSEKALPGRAIYGWDSTNEVWVKILVDASGNLQITSTDLTTILSEIQNATYGLEVIKEALDTNLGTLLTRLSSTRAGYLDNLSAGAVALEATSQLVKTETDKVPNLRFTDRIPTTPVTENVASASATNLTPGTATPTYPTGATRQRAILIAMLHVSNQAANTHNIGLKVQGQKNAGGYVDQVDLTAVVPISLINVAGAIATFAIVLDVTALVDTSGSTYTFRFVVDSDNAGSVNYTSDFILLMTYSI